MNDNDKYIEDDAGYGTFVLGCKAFSIICKSNKAIGCLLRVEVSWGNLLTKVMGGSYIKSVGIHDGTVWEVSQAAYGVLDTLEGWL